MGLGTTLLAIAIIFGIALYGSTQITTWWTDFSSGLTSSAQAKNLAPKVTPTATVCNLKIILLTQLSDSLFSTSPDQLQIVTTHYNWLSCGTGAPAFSFLPALNLDQLSSGHNNTSPFRMLDFTELVPTKIPVSIVIQNAQGFQYDSNYNSGLTQNINIPAGLFIQTPYTTTLTYLLTNVPRTDYTISASSPQEAIKFTTPNYLPAGASVSWNVYASKDSG